MTSATCRCRLLSVSPLRRGFWAGLVVWAAVLGTGRVASGQVTPQSAAGLPFYQPVHQNMPAGVAAYWSGVMGKATPPYFQPVQVGLPSRGKVTVYHGPAFAPYEIDSSRPFAFLVGYVYRIRISGMPEYPGIELYPSIEVLDRLHPPPGQELNFPIPLEFTPREIETALDGRLVTKVVFLEQPQLAPPRAQTFPIPTPELPSSVNILAEADRAGRPMAIIRLGSRVPMAGEPGFFGMGRPVYIPPQSEAEPKAPETIPAPPQERE